MRSTMNVGLQNVLLISLPVPYYSIVCRYMLRSLSFLRQGNLFVLHATNTWAKRPYCPPGSRLSRMTKRVDHELRNLELCLASRYRLSDPRDE